jgi:hypothetical protein
MPEGLSLEESPKYPEVLVVSEDDTREAPSKNTDIPEGNALIEYECQAVSSDEETIERSPLAPPEYFVILNVVGVFQDTYHGA